MVVGRQGTATLIGRWRGRSAAVRLSDGCLSSKLNPHEFIGGFERLAIACLHGDLDKRDSPGRRERTPNPYALLLEAIALRHQIAVLERSRTRRPSFRRFDRLLWILLSRWWPQWRESLMIVQPETVLRWRREGWSAIGDIDPAVTGEEGVQGFPARSAL